MNIWFNVSTKSLLKTFSKVIYYILSALSRHIWKVCLNIRLFTNYASQCQGRPRDKEGQAGTRQGQAGTGRDKQGQAGTFHFYPCFSLLFPVCPWLCLLVIVCPCLSLYVPVCPCLSLSVPVCLYICYTFMSTPADEYNSLHQYEHSYNDFPCKKTLFQCLQTLFLPSCLLFYLASSITLSFNPNNSILVINITKGSTWFLSIFLYLMLKGLLCGLWTSDHPHWLEWHYRSHCISFLFEHDKSTSEIGRSLDLYIIIVSKTLSINCINLFFIPFAAFIVLMQHKVILIVLLHMLHL